MFVFPPTTLSPTRIDVWCADPEDIRSDTARRAAHSILVPDELRRCGRFLRENDGLLYLATRVLVRTVLSRYAPISPADWRFTTSAFGRPGVVPDQPPLHFNLSNTTGIVVCAVAGEGEIGVDVEHVGRPAPLDLVDHVLAPAEAASLRRLPRTLQSPRFYDYWTLKESYVKARGLGLALPFDRFSFSFEPEGFPQVEIDPVLRDAGQSWQFVQLRPTPNHVLAVCQRRRGGRDAAVDLRWQPLDLGPADLQVST